MLQSVHKSVVNNIVDDVVKTGPLTIGVTPAVFLDVFDASTITVDGSDIVQTWADKSGSSNDVALLSGSPTYRATGSVLGGHAIDSTSNGIMTITDDATLDYDDCSVFVATGVVSGANSFSYALWKWSGGQQEFILSSSVAASGGSGRLAISDNGSTTVTIDEVGYPANGKFGVLELQFDGTTAEFIIDGDVKGTATQDIFNGTEDLKIFNGSGVLQEIFVIVFYTSVLSDARKKSIRKYINRKCKQ
ncbi:MAG: hypothetical protein MI867_12375 [Pseudomonadales bacterium]|nr:hypothetical protein [Pseudomonadales bacterium]